MTRRRPSTPVTSDPEELARELYHAHGPALERWAHGRFGDTQAAEEVVQETVLAAWRNYHQYDPSRGAERSWVFGIARNVAADRHRRSMRRLQAVPTDPAPEIAEPDVDLTGVAERSIIVDAVRALTPDHRAVVVAAYWRGLSTREISAELGIPDGTVKSRLHYAVRALRAALEERGVLS